MNNEFEQQADETIDFGAELEVEEVDESEEEIMDESSEFENSEQDETEDRSEDQDDQGSPPIEDKTSSRKPWLPELRRKYEAQQRELRELKQKLQAVEQTKQEVVQLPPEPELSDYDWDEAEYKKAVHNWYGVKAKVDQQKAVQEQKAQLQQYEQAKKLDDYNRAKTSFNKREFNESEFIATTLLSIEQQNILLQYSDDPATLVYKLGKNHDDIKKLSEIQDPIIFIKELAKTEERMKSIKVNKAVAPKAESGIPRSSVGRAGAVGNTLERLRSEAQKTGDYTKVMAYKKELKNRSK